MTVTSNKPNSLGAVTQDALLQQAKNYPQPMLLFKSTGYEDILANAG